MGDFFPHLIVSVSLMGRYLNYGIGHPWTFPDTQRGALQTYKKTSTERTRRYRQRVKQDPLLYEQYLENDRLKCRKYREKLKRQHNQQQARVHVTGCGPGLIETLAIPLDKSGAGQSVTLYASPAARTSLCHAFLFALPKTKQGNRSCIKFPTRIWSQSASLGFMSWFKHSFIQMNTEEDTQNIYYMGRTTS